MELSKDTRSFIDFLEEQYDGSLRKKDDVGVLFEIAASYEGHEELQNLIFKSKVIWNLFNTIQRNDPSTEGIEKVQTEFENSIEYFKSVLSEFNEPLRQNDLVEQFTNDYHQLSKTSVLNIVALAHDLSIIKDLQSQKK